MTLTVSAKTLITAGAWLFLFGLVEGAAVPLFANPRMALSAHLTAVQSGTALMIAGATWSVAHWSPALERLSFGAIVAGFYGLWLGLTLAAVTGASQALPMAGHGYGASRMIETGGSVLVIGSSGLLIIGWMLYTVGLLRSRR